MILRLAFCTVKLVQKFDSSGAGTGESRRLRREETEVRAATVVLMTGGCLGELTRGIHDTDVYRDVVVTVNQLFGFVSSSGSVKHVD